MCNRCKSLEYELELNKRHEEVLYQTLRTLFAMCERGEVPTEEYAQAIHDYLCQIEQGLQD